MLDMLVEPTCWSAAAPATTMYGRTQQLHSSGMTLMGFGLEPEYVFQDAAHLSS